MRLQTNKNIFFLGLLLSFVFLGSCCVHQNPFFGSHTLRKVKKSVVKISGRTSIKLVTTSTTKNPLHSLEFGTTASGSIIGHYEDLSIILTAAHVCEFFYEQQRSMLEHLLEPNEKLLKVKIEVKLKATDIEGRIFDAIQIYAQKRTDTCVIATKKIPQNALDIADKEALIGEEVFNIGLPSGIWSPNFIPMFDGRYLGHFYFTHNRNEASCYSIPGARGQSGSPIFNSYGQVIGMVHSVYSRYNHLSMSSTLKQIKGVYGYGMKLVESDYKRYEKYLDSQ